MQITRSQANALMEALQFDCVKWDTARMTKRLGDLEDLKPDDGVKDADIQTLLEEALEAGDDLVLVDDPVSEDTDDGAETEASDEAEADADANGDESDDTSDDTKPKRGRRAKKRAAAEAKKKEDKADKPKAKPKPKPKAAKAPKIKKMTMLEAAEMVLDNNDGKPLSTHELIMKMDEQELWVSPNGKTPEATLYVRMTKEEAVKGKQSRFKKLKGNQFILLKNA